MVLVPDAAGQRNRPGEAPERVCRGGNQQRPVRGGICGSAISNAVSEVCSNRGKRSDSFLNTFTKNKVDGPDSFALQKRDALGFLQKRDLSRGIVCECCYNVCTLGELQEYCP
ncbi:hypothetical protein RRG08_012324 [Elysia crispata]|uniref:Insulin-like domain-containing protein n=2 Tax=Elysia crispata TaxID=231223 RepID=A0AAE1BCM1_9GAST|nr:hypothetical protein RRG08_012324 [Elysia crispata]